MRKSFLLLSCMMISTAIAAANNSDRRATAVFAGAFSPRAYLPLLTAPPGNVLFGPVHTGEGTYYTEADGSGNCSFPPTPNDLLVAAMNQSDYGTADLCGATIAATGPKGSVVARIVDRCPECAPGDVDFSPEAFAQIADLPQGRVPISWQLVSTPPNGPVVYYFEPNSNFWWTAVQIRNHRHPLTALEFWDGGQWVNIPRVTWNYFIQQDGLGSGPFTLRITDYFGQTLVDADVPHLPDETINGAAQFPPPP